MNIKMVSSNTIIFVLLRLNLGLFHTIYHTLSTSHFLHFIQLILITAVLQHILLPLDHFQLISMSLLTKKVLLCIMLKLLSVQYCNNKYNLMM